MRNRAESTSRQVELRRRPWIGALAGRWLSSSSLREPMERYIGTKCNLASQIRFPAVSADVVGMNRMNSVDTFGLRV